MTGADVPERPASRSLNPEIHLSTLAAGRQARAGARRRRGARLRGGRPAPAGTVPAGAIALDAAFSPIQRVAYNVEMSRLGKITDYEKLVLEITTDGSISPDHAFLQASKLLRDHFDLFTPAGAEEEDDEPTAAAAASTETTRNA